MPTIIRTSLNTPTGVLALIALVAGSIVVTNTVLQGQASSSNDPVQLYIDDANTEVTLPAQTHILLQYTQGNTVALDGTVAGEWKVYKYDGSEPPYNANNFFYSNALKSKEPGTYGLIELQPNTQYYVHTDTALMFSPQTGIRILAVCGNGTVEGDESCDSVNGCSDSCRGKLGYWCTAATNTCSFLIPNLGGGSSSTQSSASSLYPSASVCGNGDPLQFGEDTEEGEECDDGNLISGDGCSGSDHPNGGCTIEFCGDGYLDTDGILASRDPNETERIWQEECDDGGYCFADGVAPWLQNAMKDASGNVIRCTTMGWPEQTECGPNAQCTVASFDGCTSDCLVEYCGDGHLQPAGQDGIQGTADDEECDGQENCTNTCKIDTSGSSASSQVSSAMSSSTSSIACNASANLNTLFAGKTTMSEILSVSQSFVQRVQSNSTTAVDDVNCDGIVNGVPANNSQSPSGDFAIIVNRITQLLLQ